MGFEHDHHVSVGNAIATVGGSEGHRRTSAAEFDRQRAMLLRCATLAHVESAVLEEQIERLRESLQAQRVSAVGSEHGRIPFVIVVKSDVVPPEVAMPLVEVNGEAGHVNMHPVEPGDFGPTPHVHIPHLSVYLMLDVETGHGALGVTPKDALVSILERGRSPLVIDEGVCLALQFPEVLQDKKRFNAFSLLGSRRADQRVPAIWVSYGKPRLGWCWENNPHTWLGSASCSGRIGA